MQPGAVFPEKDYHSFVEFGNRVVSLFPILLSLAMRGRTRPAGYTATRSSQVDPVSGSRVDETRVDPDNRL